MSRGILMFAHNSEKLDYAKLAIVSAKLACKQLKVPASLVTDPFTFKWLEDSQQLEHANQVFENIFITEFPTTQNTRILSDGASSQRVPFINSSRSQAWKFTPYKTTLLLDSDYLLFSDTLGQFWDIEGSIHISPAMKDILGTRHGLLDRYVADQGISMLWATIVLFKKDKTSKAFFDLVEHIRLNYSYYSCIYNYDHRMYRNDIAFSIAAHIMSGFTPVCGYLPPVLTAQDTDVLYSADSSGLKLIINQDRQGSAPLLCNVNGVDLHVMNKQSIIRCSDQLLELAEE